MTFSQPILLKDRKSSIHQIKRKQEIYLESLQLECKPTGKGNEKQPLTKPLLIQKISQKKKKQGPVVPRIKPFVLSFI